MQRYRRASLSTFWTNRCGSPLSFSQGTAQWMELSTHHECGQHREKQSLALTWRRPVLRHAAEKSACGCQRTDPPETSGSIDRIPQVIG